MTDEITVPVEVPVTTTTTENVPVQVQELTLFVGDATNPAAIGITLSAKDGDGNWRQDIQPVSFRREGDAATALQQALIDLAAAIPAIKAAMQEGA